ncbi:hypothetical protein D918_02962 [Trichuris suis]|nr:hypothetical protein D918_02962 [Trichuris suis]
MTAALKPSLVDRRKRKRVEQATARIVRSSCKGVAAWMEANRVDVRLVTFEALHALTVADIPNKSLFISATRNEYIAGIRLWNVN